MEQEPIIGRHLAWMRMAGKRETTVYAREKLLLRLTKWAQGPILYLSGDQLARYQQWRAAGDEEHEPISPASIRVEAVHMTQFYRWAVREELRADDPTIRLTMPRRGDYAPHPLSDEVFAAAIRQAPADIAAILSLARYAGLRACEIARLDWRDVHLNIKTPMLHVQEGKGGYFRKVHLSAALVEALRSLPERTGPVVPRADGDNSRRNSPARISQRAAKFLHEQMGTDKRQALHAFRHSFGTAMYQATRDIRATQEEMGHRSVATTQIYTAVGDIARAAAVEAASALLVGT